MFPVYFQSPRPNLISHGQAVIHFAAFHAYDKRCGILKMLIYKYSVPSWCSRPCDDSGVSMNADDEPGANLHAIIRQEDSVMPIHITAAMVRRKLSAMFPEKFSCLAFSRTNVRYLKMGSVAHRCTYTS